MTLQRGMPLYEMEKQETVGENSDGNMVIRGECVSACAYLKEQGIQVDLVYIDPPFASGADYAKKVYIRRNPKVAEVIAQAEQELDVDELKAFEEKMYGDVWDKEKYLNWMYENLMAIKSVMSENASIYVHIDWHIGHYVKILLDEVFGEDNFRNEITWVRTASHNDSKQNYSRVKDRYSNAMSGIGLSSLIEEWIVQNELTEKIYTETELLYVITELYLQICGDFRYQEHIQSICKKWIDGQTPMEINNKETIGIAEVESLCNKRISYEMNFLIGNICDLIEVDGENEEQVDQRNILTLLQKKVKYGVPNMTAISICESVFNDRLLAIELAQILSDANIGTDKILNMLKAHSEEIFSCLDSYPEYFKDRLSVLMK